MLEPLEAFAKCFDLRCTTTPLGVAPPESAAAPDEAPAAFAEALYLASLSRPGSDTSVCVLYAKPLPHARGPSVGEVLWSIAGDAVSLKQRVKTARASQHERGQFEDLRRLLGASGYQRLCSLYLRLRGAAG